MVPKAGMKRPLLADSRSRGSQVDAMPPLFMMTPSDDFLFLSGIPTNQITQMNVTIESANPPIVHYEQGLERQD